MEAKMEAKNFASISQTQNIFSEEISSTSICPPDKIIFDEERGEYICTETGEVIEERLPYLDYQHNVTRISKEYPFVPVPDNVDTLYTVIRRSSKIKEKRIRNMIVTHIEQTQRDIKYVKEVVSLSHRLNFTDAEMQEAVSIFRKIVKSIGLKKKKYIVYLAILVVLAKREGSLHNAMKEMMQKRLITHAIVSVVDSLVKENEKIREIINKTRPNRQSVILKKIDEYLEVLNIPKEHITKIMEFANKIVEHNELFMARSLNVTIATLLYILINGYGLTVTQKEIAKTVSTSEASIRSLMKQISNAKSLEIQCGKCGRVLLKYDPKSCAGFKLSFGTCKCGNELTNAKELRIEQKRIVFVY